MLGCRAASKNGNTKKTKSKPIAKKAGKFVNVTQKVVIAGGTGGGGGGGGSASKGGGFHNVYASPPPYMPTQPTWFSGPGYPQERGEKAYHNEHGVAGLAKTPSIPHAHNDMGVGDNIQYHQQSPFTSFQASSPMDVNEPSFSVPPTPAVGSTSSFSVPPTQVVGDMSTGPGPSAPVFSASSVK